MELVSDIVAQLAAVPNAAPSLAAPLLPVCAELLRDPSSQEYFRVSTAIDILGSLVRHMPNCLTQTSMAQLFSTVVRVATTTEEIALMQSSQKCLAGFVGASASSLPKGGVELLLGVVQKYLSPALPEEGAIHVGRLILKMAQTLPLDPILPQILAACLPRLANTSSPEVVQALVLVFARLIHSSPAATLDVLASQKTPDGKSGLQFLLGIWLDNQIAFYGDYVVKVTIFALMLLFQQHSSRLSGISVRGPEIASTGRRTRSKGPIQYSQISAQQKIFELILSTFVLQVMDEEDGDGGGFFDEEDDDGFSSEEDFALQGSEFDMGFSRDRGDRQKLQLDEILRQANAEQDDEDNELDPDFANDPLAKRELIPELREWLFKLMQSNVKAFEASVHACGDQDAKMGFMQIWEEQVKLQLSQRK